MSVVSTDQTTTPTTTGTDSSNKSNSTKELDIEFGHGVSEEDKTLSRRDKNAVDFAFAYSKLWCKTCKDIVLGLEKRSYAENEAYRAIVKQFQVLEASLQTGAPMKQELTDLSKMMVENHKELETHNTKRIRELLGVLTRQRTTFEKTRKFLKDKWKADVKRMLDSENSLIKTKSAYYQRCQTGVKLREELALAQNVLNELNTSQTNTSFNLNSPNLQTPTNFSPTTTTSSAPLTPGTPSVSMTTAFSPAASDTMTGEQLADASPGSTASTSSNQIAKQKAKVERLEKQLSDNDKKEIDQMYAYRETVDAANCRLCDLEKSKMEILCDTRLTILKSDEVVKDSLAELFHHFYTTRVNMINQYSTMASGFQNYVPCSDYRALIKEHIQKGADYYPEKYQYLGYHEAAMSGQKFDALSSRFLSRQTQSARDVNETDPLSDSDSEGDADLTTNTSSTAAAVSGGKSTGTNVLSSLVEFGSNLFRPDSKKSFRIRRNQHGSQSTISGSATAESLDTIALQLVNLDKEYTSACLPIGRCIIGIEKQSGGLEVPGLYRVPASKAKLASLSEHLQTNEPSTPEQLDDDIAVLTQEHPLTLAGMVKTRLLALSEPLFTYNLYPNFVDLGKAFDAPEAVDELVSRLRTLINNLTFGNRQLAGLLFHHLHRVASCEAENKMNSLNLGTMFAPTVLRQRPKFQVANMMDLIDNKGQSRVAEVLIDYASDVFGPEIHYEPMSILTTLVNTEKPEMDARRHSGPSTSRSGLNNYENTSVANQNTLGIPHAQATRTQSSSPVSVTTGSPIPMEQQQLLQQSGLTRSATVSVAPRGRSPDLMKNTQQQQQQHYSRYRGNYSPSTSPNFRSTNLDSSTTICTQDQGALWNRRQLPETNSPKTAESTTVSDSIPTSPTAAKNTSVVRTLLKRYGSGLTDSSSIAQTGLKQTTSTTSSDSQTKQTVEKTEGSALSGLVIGKRRPFLKVASESPALHKLPINLEEYSYIDNDE